MKLKMGTRGSPLALAQSGMVASALARLHQGLEVETVRIRTSGDRFSAASPQEARRLSQGAKGLFVKEIEEALAAGAIDFAVHSGKDLPADLLCGLSIAAYPEREDARDAFIGRGGMPWSEMKPGLRIGTTSLRRQVQLLAAKPGLVMRPLRGNVDTRLRKLEEGVCDGIVLALAGLRRLGLTGVPHEPLSEELVLPSPAQGALAVETRADRSDIVALVSRLDHPATRLEVEFERCLLKELGGGCSVPLAARAKAQGGAVAMSVFYSDPDGSRAARVGSVCPDPSRRSEFVKEIADQVRRRRG
ncbi:MAG: hydroxymethylbilane synthase [Elusimicrobia bacterium]|nr:hydroxymethylbilane synthase [Elusimicrobiota bacterium]